MHQQEHYYGFRVRERENEWICEILAANANQARSGVLNHFAQRERKITIIQELGLSSDQATPNQPAWLSDTPPKAKAPTKQTDIFE
jgi:hypothetical protein